LLETKGGVNLHVSDDALAHIRLSVALALSGVRAGVQTVPKCCKFQADKENVVALTDPDRRFLVNKPLGGDTQGRMKPTSTSLLYLCAYF
jgi:hypothetical protein